MLQAVSPQAFVIVPRSGRVKGELREDQAASDVSSGLWMPLRVTIGRQPFWYLWKYVERFGLLNAYETRRPYHVCSCYFQRYLPFWCGSRETRDADATVSLIHSRNASQSFIIASMAERAGVSHILLAYMGL